MTRRAFVPAALIEAQPRIYKSFRGRQLKGLLLGAGGAALVLILVGLSDFTGYALAFLAALPGFAYGYYQPEGRPVEEWLLVLYRFYATSQRISCVPPRRPWERIEVLRVVRTLFQVPRGAKRVQGRRANSGR